MPRRAKKLRYLKRAKGVTRVGSVPSYWDGGKPSYSDLFYTGRFDFVVYEKMPNNAEYPVLAIELDDKEHFDDETVKVRDKKKQKICADHHFVLIRVENSYARRYYLYQIDLRNIL